MQTMGEALNEIREQLQGTTSDLRGSETSPKWDERTLERMLDLPATSVLIQDVDRCAGFAASSLGLPNAKYRLVSGIKRDAVQAERPPECWCLGLGGRNRVEVGWLNDELVYGWRSFCSCPDGVAAERRQLENVRQVGRYNAKLRRGRVWVDATIPPRYQSVTFRGWLDLIRQNAPGSLREAKGAVLALYQALWRKRGPVWLYGPVGSGKTGLAAACLRELVRADIDGVLFVTAPDLMLRIQATFSRVAGEPTTAEVLASVRDAEVLVIDDFGQEHGTEWSRSMLWDLVNARSAAMKQTIYTSNLNPEQLAKRAGEATASRILEDATVINLAGFPDLRLRKHAA